MTVAVVRLADARRTARREEQRRYREMVRAVIGEVAYLARRAEELRAYRAGGSARVYATDTDRAREKQRRRRARLRTRGLNAKGSPVVRPDLQRAQLARFECPRGCICRDCLFPATEYRPRVVRYLGCGT